MVEAVQEPGQPVGDVEITFLRVFKDVVVGIALLPDLRRHGVEAVCAFFRAREAHIRNRARDPAVPVGERMDRHEPEMRKCGL